MGWTVRGSNPSEDEIFSTQPHRPLGPPIFLYSGYRVSFLGVKRTERVVNHSPSSSAEVKQRVELHLWVYMACSRVNITFLLLPRSKHMPSGLWRDGDVRITQYRVASAYLSLLWKSNKYYALCVCVFAAFVIQHAKRMRHIKLSSITCLALPYFSTLSHKWHDSEK